jgi:hypothetical protein
LKLLSENDNSPTGGIKISMRIGKTLMEYNPGVLDGSDCENIRIDNSHFQDDIWDFTGLETTNGGASRLLLKFSHIRKKDIRTTHTAPSHICNKIVTDAMDDPTSQALDKVYKRVKFSKWYFGHWHIDTIIDRRFRCLFNDIVRL